MRALAQANGSRTILLAPGNYGDLVLAYSKDSFVKFSATVTIKSLDPKNMATFKSVRLIGVQNLVLDSVRFNYVSEPGAADWTRPNEIIGASKHVAIVNSIFAGDLARGIGGGVDGYGTGFGLFVAESEDIVVRNNKFFNWVRAAVFTVVSRLSVQKNEIYKIRSDGFNFAEVSDTLIEENYFHDFAADPSSDDHADMIQFWTSGTKNPSTNIAIRRNVLISGRGIWTQSIFIRNELVDTKEAGDEMFYRNIAIEDNVIYNAHAHGISVGETHGLKIRNNTVLQNRATGDEKLIHVPRIILLTEGSTDVLIENNIVSLAGNPKLTMPSAPTAVIQNNLIAQRERPSAPNYYGRLFVNALADGDVTLEDIRALPGSVVEQMGVGARLTRFPEHPESPMGFIVHMPGVGLSSLTHNFSARNIFAKQGRVDTERASVLWDFGDGKTAQGLTATHQYARAGRYIVKARVGLPDGRTVRLNRTIVVLPALTGN